MTVSSLGYRTDLLFTGLDAVVTDCGDHCAIRTPTNPSFHWGNFLLFDSPPKSGDLERWQGLFAAEIGTPPLLPHFSFGWDSSNGETGEVQQFLDAGYRMDQSAVLAANAVHRPTKYCEEVEVRPLAEDWEWQAALDAQVASREPIYSEVGYRSYRIPKMTRYRKMSEAGIGHWFGAFLNGRLVGDLGLFVFEGLGRFQSVGTHPNFRRRGVCGALVYKAAECGLAVLGAETLVMVADIHYHAARIYESIGFSRVERQVGITWWKPDTVG